jgi:hypothetical protein
MIKRVLVCLFLSFLIFTGSVTSADASEKVQPFYHNVVGKWSIWGHPGNNEGLHPACIMEKLDAQGASLFQIVTIIDGKSLFTKITMVSSEWKGIDPDESPKDGIMVHRMLNGESVPVSMKFYVRKTNEAHVLLENPLHFFDSLISSRSLDFYLNLDSIIFVPLQSDTYIAVDNLLNCIDTLDKKGTL